MNELIHLLIWIPFLGSTFILFLPRPQEKLVSFITHSMMLSHLLVTVALLGLWIHQGAHPWSSTDITLYKSDNFRFGISFLLDSISACFLGTLSVVCFAITRYALVYLAKDEGFARFFSAMGYFLFGYTLVVLANNFEILFAGWEFLGITSFLLISFYRYRTRPVKNALKIFTIYRVGDVGLLLGAWLSQLVWHENIHFNQLGELSHLLRTELGLKEALGVSLLIVFSAAAKSAQFPFCFWLPKAMEGPTPSSAIFYGALSIHVGVYVLLRMFPLWGGFDVARALLFSVGLLTSFLSASAARVQSNIKAQVAYSSLIQVGFMFCEAALGFTQLVLVHLISNAFLRGYQLLVSPSVISYLIRFHNESTPRQEGGLFHSFQKRFPRFGATWYLIALREGNLEYILEALLWRPLKELGSIGQKILSWKTIPWVGLFGFVVALLGMSARWGSLVEPVSPLVSLGAILISLTSLSERDSSRKAWTLLGLTQIFVVASVSSTDHFSAEHIRIYLSGTLLAWPLGIWIISRLDTQELNSFYGNYALFPRRAFLFLVCGLVLSGFPISPTFLGEDLILHHASQGKIGLAVLIAFCFIISGISSLRIYSRLFLGPRRSETKRSI